MSSFNPGRRRERRKASLERKVEMAMPSLATRGHPRAFMRSARALAGLGGDPEAIARRVRERDAEEAERRRKIAAEVAERSGLELIEKIAAGR